MIFIEQAAGMFSAIQRVVYSTQALNVRRYVLSVNDSVQGKEEVHVGLACLEFGSSVHPFPAVSLLPSRGGEANARGSGNSGGDPGAHGS